MTARVPSPSDPRHVRLMLGVRQIHHWSQRDLAAELGVSLSTIAAWENLRSQPHPMWIAVLRRLLASGSEG